MSEKPAEGGQIKQNRNGRRVRWRCAGCALRAKMRSDVIDEELKNGVTVAEKVIE